MRAAIFSLLALVTVGCAAGTAVSSSADEVVAGSGVALRDLALDPATGTLAFHYTVGGGCAEHTPKTTVALTEANGGLLATVTVSDVSSAPDGCEALLTLGGEADLKALVATEAARQGFAVANRRVVLDLPSARTTVEPREDRLVPIAGAVRAEVEHLSRVALDANGQLSFAYTTGGGCAEHKGAARVELASTAAGIVAKVVVEDVSPAPDFCEAIVGVESTADLSALISEAGRASNLAVDFRAVTIELPNAALDL